MVETKLDTFLTAIGLGGINLFVLMHDVQSVFAFLTVTITMVIAFIKLKEMLNGKKDKNKN